METSDIIALGSLLIAAISFFVSKRSRQTAKDANRIAILDRKWLVLYGIVETARNVASHSVDQQVYGFFIKHTLLAEHLGFGGKSLAYINDFKAKLERLKLLQAFDKSMKKEADLKEAEELTGWFFEQQRGAISALEEDIRIDSA